jgi:hydrogenase nickel incorporation protein HypA/HybF
MHELAVMGYLLESVEERARLAGASKVLTINLVVGERSGFVDDSLLFYFDLLTPDTVAEGARLHVRRTPMRFHCAACDHDYAPVGVDFDCPTCGVVGQVRDDGTQMLIESIEIET